VRRINLALADAAPGGVSLLDSEAVAADAGMDRWANPRLWYLARQHPSAEVLPELAEELMAHVRAVLGLSRKVLVCDLDNTLWQGVIGEDGIGGIAVGPGSPEGEAYADLQRYLRELKERGIVLAVNSKNNPADAEAPFRDKKGMVLRLEDFAVFLANWDDKATNLRRIAETIGVGLDSLVMLEASCRKSPCPSSAQRRSLSSAISIGRACFRRLPGPRRIVFAPTRTGWSANGNTRAPRREIWASIWPACRCAPRACRSTTRTSSASRSSPTRRINST
jgi:HAD superfamily phosphatase (TIGR01681 family)